MLSTFNFSLEHHDHQESDDKRVPMVNLKNPQKNARGEQHTNQGKQNHQKWIESYGTGTQKLAVNIGGITKSGLKA